MQIFWISILLYIFIEEQYSLLMIVHPYLATLLCVLYLCLLCRSNNLLCNGDFQAYTVTTDYQGQLYDYIPSNLSCWYNKGGGNIQVKKKTDPVASQVAQLTSNVAYTLCQKITLSVIEQYQLTYDLLCPNHLSNLKLSVKLNGVLISTLNISSSYQFASGQVIFTPSASVNEFCFSQSHSAFIIYMVIGGNLDNVTLVQLTNNSAIPPPEPSTNESTITNTTSNISDISNSTTNETTAQATNTSSNSSQTVFNTTNNTIQNITYDPGVNPIPPLPIDFNNYDLNDTTLDQLDMSSLDKQIFVIHFTTEVKEIWGQIHFISDIDYQEWMQSYLDTRMKIYFEGEIQNDFDLKESDSGKFNIIVAIKRNYQINTIEFIVPDDASNLELFQFQLYVDGKSINFKLLTESEAKIIQNVEPLAEFLSQIVSQTHFILSSTFCSYFLLNLLNFWNISLMYHFLRIKTIPAFVKSIYEYSLDLLYNRGSLLTWIITLFSIPEETFEFELEKDIPEEMDEFRSGYSWFGIYSLSSLFLKSNFQNIFVIGLSIVKLLLVKLIIFVIGLKCEGIRQFRTNFISVFLAQVISLVPFFIISAFTNMTQSYLDQKGKLEKIIQILVLFIFTLVIFLWLIHQDRIIPPNKVSVKVSNKDITHAPDAPSPSQTKMVVNSKAVNDRAQMVCDINIFCLSISVPISILLQQSQAFFLINFIIILNSFIYLIKNRKKISMKIFRFLILFVWMIHHLTFILFYLLEQAENIFTEYFQSRMQVICGIIVLFTVLLGGAIEIIQFIFDVGIIVFKIVKKIINKCKQLIKQDEKIYPETLKSIQGEKTLHSKEEFEEKKKKEKRNNALSVKDIEYEDQEEETYETKTKRNKQTNKDKPKKTQNPNLITIKVLIKKRGENKSTKKKGS